MTAMTAAATRWFRSLIPNWARVRWKLPRCTTPNATGRPTTRNGIVGFPDASVRDYFFFSRKISHLED